MVRVIDTSVAIKWFVEEDSSDSAVKILSEVIKESEDFAVPELFYFELIHVFHRLVPRPTHDQQDNLRVVLTLPIQRFRMTIELANEMRAFQKMGLSGYDASYVALAKLLGGRWLTFDKKAFSVIRKYELGELL